MGRCHAYDPPCRCSKIGSVCSACLKQTALTYVAATMSEDSSHVECCKLTLELKMSHKVAAAPCLLWQTNPVRSLERNWRFADTVEAA